MEYSLKRGFRPDLERIQEALKEEFPGQISREGDDLHLSYGALKSITVRLDGKKMNVVTEANPEADDAEILDTNHRFRNFLEKATGYTAKQRLKMAKKEAQQG
ncbi:MAG: DUF5611 family protein [Methanotrichaceae archaeon]|nr:DUF5611 family protein [Methanotrichaceae archaeon]